MKDSASGSELAHAGDRFLWFVPACMLAIIVLGLVRLIWQQVPALFAMAGIVGGGLSAYLMIHERAVTNGSPGLIATQWTILFWLGVAASVGIGITAFFFYSTRSRSP